MTKVAWFSVGDGEAMGDGRDGRIGGEMEVGECRNCYFFTKSREVPYEEGFCHRYPKIESHLGCYWCGEFKRKYGEVSFYDGEEQK